MSTEAPVGLTIVEKLLGLIIILIGALTFYVTYTNMSSIGQHTLIFLIAGLTLIALGVFMLIAKVE